MTAVSSTTAAPPSAVAAPAASSATEIQDRFLKLLVTQIKNQDPLNPLDNQQITTQLAQINTVNGIAEMNSTMKDLAASLGATQSVQSASMIGRAVIAEGNTLQLVAGAPALGGLDLPQAADTVSVSVVGPSGNVVRQIELGARSAGNVGFQWDGLTDGGAAAAPGTYTFQVKAMSGAQKITATPLVAGTVSSISLGSDGLHLTVGGVGEVKMSQVKSIM